MKTVFRKAKDVDTAFPGNPPTEENLAKLECGNWAKVCGETPDGNTEQFWTLVTDIDDDKISGRVDQDLVLIKDFSDGDTISFTKENICGILRKGE